MEFLSNAPACAVRFSLFNSILPIRVIRGSMLSYSILKRAAARSGRLRSRLGSQPRAAFLPLPRSCASCLSRFYSLASIEYVVADVKTRRQNFAHACCSASSIVPTRSCHNPRRNSQQRGFCRQKRVSRQNSRASRPSSEVCVQREQFRKMPRTTSDLLVGVVVLVVLRNLFSHRGSQLFLLADLADSPFAEAPTTSSSYPEMLNIHTQASRTSWAPRGRPSEGRVCPSHSPITRTGHDHAP
jgi:hypothetical protein